MAAVLTEPDTAKAAVSGTDPGMVHLTFPIEKRQDTDTINPLDGTPDVVVWGKATDGTLDSDLQIVDPEWSLKALRDWFDTKANVRMQHDPKQPVGRGLDVDGHYVKSLICDPKAKYFIRQGILNDYSVGIVNPDIRSNRDPRFAHLPDAGKAVKGIITGRPDGTSGFGEITVCDRGSNYGTSFTVAKSAADGSLMLVDELHGEPPEQGERKQPKGVTLTLPKDVSVTMKPSDLARLATFRQRLVMDQAAAKAAAARPAPVTLNKTAEPGAVKRDFDPDVGEHGTDRDTMPASDFAGRNRSFPIHDASDVSDALQSIGRAGPDNYSHAKLRRNILRIARRKGFPVPDSAKKPKKDKAAAPAVTKCMKCDGTGMHEGKPCPDCAGADKKRKVKCLSCGAHQNRKHDHCSECGQALAGNSAAIMKNHDFSCLNCDRELDKGEKFCPGCGTPNPGHNPMADQKIPANKAAKERVPSTASKAKSKPRKKKGEPFGGHQAPEFGSKPGDGKDGKPPKAEKRKGKGKGRSPAKGVTGQHTRGLPPHREPDGPAIEEFEHDTALEDGDQREEMAAAMRHKSSGLPPHLAVLHDLTCPAFDPAAVTKALPAASFAGIDADWWLAETVKAAAGADMGQVEAAYGRARILAAAAVTLKTADPQLLHEVRLGEHAAFRAANKTFTDATPGPGSFPTPGHCQPGQFRRPYVSAGHAAESPQSTGERSFPVPAHHPGAEDFTRGYLTAGHAADAPANSEPRSEPISPAMPPGAPGRVHYQDMQRADYATAMHTMHDNLARIAPAMCPMESPPAGETQKPAPQVPAAVGAPVPHAGKSAKAKAAARKAAKARAQKKRKARKKDRMREETAMPDATKAAGMTPGAPQPDLAGALKAAVAPLVKSQKRQARTIRRQQKMLDAMADTADTRNAPYRGAGAAPVSKASAGLAAPRTAAEAAELAQTAELQRLHATWRGSHIPAEREAAEKAIMSILGVNKTMNPTSFQYPMQT